MLCLSSFCVNCVSKSLSLVMEYIPVKFTMTCYSSLLSLR